LDLLLLNPILTHHFLIRGKSIWLFIVPGSVLACLLALPLAALLVRTLDADFMDTLVAPTAFAALRVSLITSTLSTLLAILTGTPLAYTVARWPFRARSWLELLIDLPVVLPPAVAGLALLITFGRRGLLGPLLEAIGISVPFTTAAVVLAQTFVSAPLYVRAARIGFAAVDVQLEEAAYTEGANQWQLFRHVMLPLVGRSLFSGAILCWARALGEFGATILFAGNLVGRTQTMPLAIYLGFESDLNLALALSAILLLVSILLMALLRRLETRSGHS
jgi:molybdate transport system permease protein